MLPFPFDHLENGATRALDLEDGEVLFREGGRTRGLFCLKSGRVNLERLTETGTLIVIHSARAGETFAEASLFSDTYHCNAVAIGAASLVELDRGEVLSRFRTDQEFAANMAGRFANQIQGYRRRLELMAIRSAEERVYQGMADGLLRHDIKTFASEIGLTHEATYRSLGRLCKKGRITKSRRGKYFVRRP